MNARPKLQKPDIPTWECEALPPKDLQQALTDAIESNMNLEIFEAEAEQEAKDEEEIHKLRQAFAQSIGD